MSFLIDLTCYDEDDGKLGVFETNIIPDFCINRVFYIFDVPGDKQRADHACMNSRIVLIAIAGSVSISMEIDGTTTKYILDHKSKALFVPAGSWIRAYDFSSESILLGLSELTYDDCVYVDDYSEHKSIIKG